MQARRLQQRFSSTEASSTRTACSPLSLFILQVGWIGCQGCSVARAARNAVPSLATSLKGGIRRLTTSSFCTCLQNQPHTVQADFLLPQEQRLCSDYSNLNPMYHLAATSGAQCTPKCSSCKPRLCHIHLLMLVADGSTLLRACSGGRKFVRKALRTSPR